MDDLVSKYVPQLKLPDRENGTWVQGTPGQEFMFDQETGAPANYRDEGGSRMFFQSEGSTLTAERPSDIMEDGLRPRYSAVQRHSFAPDEPALGNAPEPEMPPAELRGVQPPPPSYPTGTPPTVAADPNDLLSRRVAGLAVDQRVQQDRIGVIARESVYQRTIGDMLRSLLQSRREIPSPRSRPARPAGEPPAPELDNPSHFNDLQGVPLSEVVDAGLEIEDIRDRVRAVREQRTRTGRTEPPPRQ